MPKDGLGTLRPIGKDYEWNKQINDDYMRERNARIARQNYRTQKSFEGRNGARGTGSPAQDKAY